VAVNLSRIKYIISHINGHWIPTREVQIRFAEFCPPPSKIFFKNGLHTHTHTHTHTHHASTPPLSHQHQSTECTANPQTKPINWPGIPTNLLLLPLVHHATEKKEPIFFCVRLRVVGCWCGYLSGARCRFAHGLAVATATATHSLLLQ